MNDHEAAETRRHRVELAAAHRVAVLENLHEGTWNHFSVALGNERYLVSPGDRHFATVTASDLLEMDAEGRVVAGAGRPNPSAFIIHHPIHVARPDAVCVLHAHPPHATALTMAAGRLLDERASQMAANFFGDVAYLDYYGGLLSELDEGRTMARALGAKRVLLLRSHGVLVVGTSVSNALYDLYCLERAARMQLLAGDLPLAGIPVEFAHGISAEARGPQGYLEGMQHLLRLRQPDYLD